MPVTPGTAMRECVRVMSPSASSTLDQVCLIVESGATTCGNNLKFTDCFPCGIHSLIIYIIAVRLWFTHAYGHCKFTETTVWYSALCHHYF